MLRFLKPLGCAGMSGLFLLVLSGTAKADTVVFDTCGSAGSPPPHGTCTGQQTFTSSPSSTTIKVDGFTPASNSGSLFAKQGGGDENGMGLTNDGTGDDEITPGSFIQITIPTSLVGVPLTITMGSTTGHTSTTTGDEWEIFENTSAGTLSGGTVEGNDFGEGSTDTLTFTPGLGDLYIDVTSLNGNVLLSSLSFTTAPTPEPSGLALLGTGILGLAGVVRRKLKV